MTASVTARSADAGSAPGRSAAPETAFRATADAARPGRRRGQRGSAAVLVVVIVCLLTALAVGGSVAGGLLVAHRRAASAADLAALAGADTLAQGGSEATRAGSGCDRAAQVGAENGARLAGCRVDAREIVVRAAVDVTNPFGGTWEVLAVARAGPAERWPTAEGGSGP